MGESSCKHLPHASVVIRTFNSFDLEFPVVIPLGLSSLINNHGSDRLKSIRIRDIICLHAADIRNPDQFFNLPDCSDGPSLFSFQTFSVFTENQGCIVGSQFHQLFLRAFFRHADIDFSSSFYTQPFFQKRGIFNLFLQHQFARNKRRPRIILLDKTIQDLTAGLSLGNPKIEVIPSDQAASPDKKYLNDRILLLYCCCKNISVLSAAVCDFLLLSNLFYASEQFSILYGFLKFQFFRSLLHLLFQILQNPVKISIQKTDHF